MAVVVHLRARAHRVLLETTVARKACANRDSLHFACFSSRIKDKEYLINVLIHVSIEYFYILLQLENLVLGVLNYLDSCMLPLHSIF